MQAKFTPLPPSPVPRALPHESSTFIWPTQGEISRDFDHQASRRHDGIDISAPQGTAIYAAADGEVIFSDWGPGGYGYMVIVQHQADMVTIYAHNQENLVNVGQRVRQGERIATVGKSGRATGYHLHFEVRRNATPISPYSLLPRRPDRLAALDRG
jgi:murein DD-endopeptidase MepM/ murein hydrolase activator NlpD